MFFQFQIIWRCKEVNSGRFTFVSLVECAMHRIGRSKRFQCSFSSVSPIVIRTEGSMGSVHAPYKPQIDYKRLAWTHWFAFHRGPFNSFKSDAWIRDNLSADSKFFRGNCKRYSSFIKKITTISLHKSECVVYNLCRPLLYRSNAAVL